MGKNNKDKNEPSMWDNFDPNNMTDDQRDNLLGQVYGGYKQTTPKPVYGMAGAGDGRAMRKTGEYTTSTDYDYYEDHPAWNPIATNLGITGAIDNQQELGVMSNYVAHYGKDKELPEMPEAAPEESAPEESPEIEYSPEITRAKQFVNRFESDTSSPYNDLSSQDFLNAYTKGFDSRKNTDGVGDVGANLNTDLTNNVSTTDNNTFADTTFNPVDKPKEAAQNFLENKKGLVLNKFK